MRADQIICQQVTPKIRPSYGEGNRHFRQTVKHGNLLERETMELVGDYTTPEGRNPCQSTKHAHLPLDIAQASPENFRPGMLRS